METLAVMSRDTSNRGTRKSSLASFSPLFPGRKLDLHLPRRQRTCSSRLHCAHVPPAKLETNIHGLVCPAQSPDLVTIENICLKLEHEPQKRASTSKLSRLTWNAPFARCGLPSTLPSTRASMHWSILPFLRQVLSGVSLTAWL